MIPYFNEEIVFWYEITTTKFIRQIYFFKKYFVMLAYVCYHQALYYTENQSLATVFIRSINLRKISKHQPQKFTRSNKQFGENLFK